MIKKKLSHSIELQAKRVFKKDLPSLERTLDKEISYLEKYNSAATIKRKYTCKEQTHTVKVTHR